MLSTEGGYLDPFDDYESDADAEIAKLKNELEHYKRLAALSHFERAIWHLQGRPRLRARPNTKGQW